MHAFELHFDPHNCAAVADKMVKISMIIGVQCTFTLFDVHYICRHPIYYGDAQLATEWFHKLGYTIPYLINAADFILDLASGDVSTKKISGADSRLHLINCAERFLTVSLALPSCPFVSPGPVKLGPIALCVFHSALHRCLATWCLSL